MELKLYLGGLHGLPETPSEVHEIESYSEILPLREKFIKNLYKKGVLIPGKNYTGKLNYIYIFQDQGWAGWRKPCDVCMKINRFSWTPTRDVFEVFVQFEGQNLKLMHSGYDRRKQQDIYDHYRNYPGVIYCEDITRSIPFDPLQLYILPD